MFFYYQVSGGQDPWRPGLLDARTQVIEEHQPRYVTALALSRTIESGLAADELDKITYSGPFYVDFDAKELETAITQVNLFLDKLEAKGVKLSTLSLYATGGRGFHIEVPMETFIAKAAKTGMPHLPHIYKELAYQLYVDTLDLRVYTAKRGRMWRTVNVQRENGLYKVPVLVHEVRAMTPDLYAELCAAPRKVLPAVAYSAVKGDPKYVPEPDAPELAHDFAVLFAEALLKVKDGAAKRKKNAKQLEILAKFKGEFPPTLKAVLANQSLREDAGWNQIAMQIAITANGLGMDHDKVIEAAQPLLQGHAGDGRRYNTPTKREEELRAQLAYTADNPCYQFAVGAIKAILVEGTPAFDLDGVTDERTIKDLEAALVERQQASVELEGEEGENQGEIVDEAELERGIVVGRNGIRQKTKEGWVTWAQVGFDRVSLIMRAVSGKPMLFEADMFMRGAPRGRVQIPLETFLSRQKFHAFITAETGASFQGSDATVQAIQEAMVQKARLYAMSNKHEYALTREGLDVVEMSGNYEVPQEASAPFPVWVTVNGCEAPARISNAGLSFTFKGDPNPAGMHKTDLKAAPPLEEVCDQPQLRDLLHAIFNMNRPRAIGPMLGWLAAAHGRMFYHHIRGAFPLLGVAGEAGAGKTTTLRALGKLHFFKVELPEVAAFGATPHAIEEAVLSSCSVPVCLSEYKPRTANPERLERLRSTFRSAYDNGTIRKGGGVQNVGTSAREISDRKLSGPIAYVGIALENETELVERTVQCVFDKGGHAGREKHMAVVQRDAKLLSSVGREITRLLLASTIEEFRDSFEADYKIVHEKMYTGNNSRIVYNYAIALHGLTMLQEVLSAFGLGFEDDFDVLRTAVLEGPISLGGDVVLTTSSKGTPIYEAKAEAAKALSTLAVMSLTGRMDDSTYLKIGTDYKVYEANGEEILELCVPFAYAKLEEWSARHRRPMLYDSEESFRFALKNFIAFMDATPVEMTEVEGVYRFRLAEMRRAQVSAFRKK